jgi:hypothetical protein
VERKGEVYRVSLKLLDVKAKTVDVGVDEMPISGSVAGLSRRLYVKLVGDVPTSGTVVVTARAQGGATVDGAKVFVDEERRGVLAGGRLAVTGVTEGHHVVAVEATGLARFEAAVTVRIGEQTTLDALLVDKADPASRSHALLWKVSLGAGLAVAAGGGAAAWFGDHQQKMYQGKLNAKLQAGAQPDATVGVDDCGDTSAAALQNITTQRKITFDGGALRHACNWHKVNVGGFVALGVGGVAALASLVLLIRDPGSSEEPLPTGARGKRPDVAIAPILLPDVAGASLALRW